MHQDRKNSPSANVLIVWIGFDFVDLVQICLLVGVISKAEDVWVLENMLDERNLRLSMLPVTIDQLNWKSILEALILKT